MNELLFQDLLNLLQTQHEEKNEDMSLLKDSVVEIKEYLKTIAEKDSKKEKNEKQKNNKEKNKKEDATKSKDKTSNKSKSKSSTSNKSKSKSTTGKAATKAAESVVKFASKLNIASSVVDITTSALTQLSDFTNQQYKNYEQLNQLGLVLSGSMFDLTANSKAVGLTQKEFTTTMKSHSKLFAKIGSNFDEALGDSVRHLNLYDQSISKLGLSNQEALNLSAYKLETDLKTAKAGEKQNKLTTKEHKKYLKEISLLSRITGESRESIAKNLSKAVEQVDISAGLDALSDRFSELNTDELLSNLQAFGFDNKEIGSLFNASINSLYDETALGISAYNQQLAHTFESIKDAAIDGDITLKEQREIAERTAREQESHAKYLNSIGQKEQAAIAQRFALSSKVQLKAIATELEREAAIKKSVTSQIGAIKSSLNFVNTTLGATFGVFLKSFDDENKSMSDAFSDAVDFAKAEFNKFWQSFGADISKTFDIDFDNLNMTDIAVQLTLNLGTWLSDTSKTLLSSLFKKSKDIQKEVLNVLASFDLVSIVDSFIDTVNNFDFMSEMNNVADYVSTVIADMINKIPELLPTADDLEAAVKNVISQSLRILIKSLSFIVSSLFNIVTNIPELITNAVKNTAKLIDKIEFSEVIGAVVKTLKAAVTGLLSGLYDGLANGVLGSLEDLNLLPEDMTLEALEASVKASITGALDSAGGFILDGLKGLGVIDEDTTLDDTKAAIKSSVHAVFSSITSAVTGMLSGMKSMLLSIAEKVPSFLGGEDLVQFIETSIPDAPTQEPPKPPESVQAEVQESAQAEVQAKKIAKVKVSPINAPNRLADVGYGVSYDLGERKQQPDTPYAKLEQTRQERHGMPVFSKLPNYTKDYSEEAAVPLDRFELKEKKQKHVYAANAAKELNLQDLKVSYSEYNEAAQVQTQVQPIQIDREQEAQVQPVQIEPVKPVEPVQIEPVKPVEPAKPKPQQAQTGNMKVQSTKVHLPSEQKTTKLTTSDDNSSNVTQQALSETKRVTNVTSGEPLLSKIATVLEELLDAQHESNDLLSESKTSNYRGSI